VKTCERSELFGNGQRAVVGQHDAARPQQYLVGVCRYMGDQDRCCRGRDGGDVVMFGVPDSPVPAFFSGLGHQQAGLKCLGDRVIPADERQVKNRKWNLVASHS
jgi:hypothetical protein